MAAPRKFGAFTGVFTPSVLTILGVIMYMRLPWIVGQGGVTTTIGIVLVAHIISVTTGLSVSSIATDKRVKAGGTYFMISRSLGLPIGGTLGLALFVGLSFSVSLYVIGFSESFLAFWDLEISRNTIRLAGTITLVAVTTVTFISTAFALKTQYYILTAIVLSLLSIVLGRHEFAPDVTAAATPTSAVPFIVLFGIFFPAVTGFEAGVSMSGDLRDPKKSLPAGTIAAIATGLVVYIALATFLGRTVNAEVLRTNPSVLLDIALVPPLVVAGVWGATISSAFGSILGAPRILQATAVDRITPRFLAHGHGKENEPRRAMLFTFAIAEAGILIGELDVIARVVSMFFITTYGFLNLTAAIESWVSPDFRPEFRVPRIVPTVGAIACFVVMIQLDFLAMIGSTIVLGGVYLFLTRKQLTLESGDTWEGVWSSLARSALRRLNSAVPHRRNWRPNILQFGNPNREPELLEFAGTLTENRGLLTNVEVVPSATPFLRSETRDTSTKDEDGNVFYRVVEVPEQYEGIATIAGVYGFSGIDPNTVMLGWPDDAAEDDRFIALLKRLAAMNHNLLLLRTREQGFGERQRVNIWWPGHDRNIGFAIALVRFLTSSDDWPLTQVQFFVVNDGDRSLNEPLSRGLRVMLDEQRVDGTVRIISNGLERRPLQDILGEESGDCDLTVLGLSDKLVSSPQAALQSMSRLLQVTGTTLVIRASTFFPETSIIPRAYSTTAASGTTDDESATLPELIRPKAVELVTPVLRLDDATQHLGSELASRFVRPTLAAYGTLLNALEESMETTFQNLRDAKEAPDRPRRRRAVSRVHSAFLFHTDETLETFGESELGLQHDRLGDLTSWYDGAWADVLANAPDVVRVTAPGKRRSRRVRFGKSRGVYLREPTEVVLLDVMRSTERAARDTLGALSTLFRRINDGIGKVEAAYEQDAVQITDVIDHECNAASALIESTRDMLQHTRHDVEQGLAAHLRNCVNRFVLHLNGEKTGRRARKRSRAEGDYLEDVAELCQSWSEARKLELNEAVLAVRLSGFRDRLDTIVERGTNDLMLEIANNFLDPLTDTARDIQEALKGSSDLADTKPVYDGKQRFEGAAIVNTLVQEIERAADELPEETELPAYTDSSDAEGLAAGRFPVRDAVQFLVDMQFAAPVRDALDRAAPHLDSAANVAQDVVQLAGFYLDGTGESGDDGTGDTSDAVVTSAVERLDVARSDVVEQRDILDAFIDQRLRSLRDELHAIAVHRAAALLGRHERTLRGRVVIARFGQLLQSAVGAIKQRLVRLQYRRSEGILLARRLGLSGQRVNDATTTLRAFVDDVSPSPNTLAQLPSYYRQLFLGAPTIALAGRTAGRGQEVAEATDVATKHANGASGALAIVGPPRSGRSTVARLLANRTFEHDEVYHVHSIPGGSTEPNNFLRQLGWSLGRRGSLEMMMHGLAENATIFIHDVELWWERRDGGDAVVELLIDLISRHSQRCQIVFTVTDRVFDLLGHLTGLEQHVLGVVLCRPFDAEDLKDAVLTRHESTGLTYALNGIEEGELGDWAVAKMFTDYFRYCRGNVGDAMHAWIGHIDSVKGQTLHMRTPGAPDTDALELLRPVQIGLLIQIIVHRQLTFDRLTRITPLRESELRTEIETLQRIGLVNRRGDVLDLNRFVEPHIIRRFAEARHI